MKVRVYNIGGIRKELELEIPKSVTIYNAPNAYGKTSLARAIVSLLTSNIKAEELLNVFADEGYVELELDGKVYYRRLKRIRDNIIEDKRLIMDDESLPLVVYFSPENKLVTQIISNNNDIEWFISTTSKIHEIKKKREEVELKLKIAKEELSDYEKKYKEVLDIQSKIKAIDEEIERLEKESENLNIINKTDTSLFITRKNKLDEIKSKIELKREDLMDTEKKLDKVNKEIEALENKLSTFSKENLNKELENINTELQEKSKTKNSIEIEIRLLERIIEDIKEADKTHASTCYLCGTQVDPSIWRVRIEKLSNELNLKQNIIEKINKELLELRNKKNEIENLIRDLQNAEVELVKLRSKKEEYLRKVETLKFQIDELERQKREMEERFNRELTSISFDYEKDSINKRIEELRKQRSAYEYELQTIGMPSSVLEKIAMKRKEVESLEEQAEKLQREYLRRLTAVREEFMKLSSKILKELEFDFDVQIDNNNKIRVYRNNVELELKKLATSEKVSLALILILAALKAYYKPPFFIVDESFMTFDQKRFDKLIKILNTIVEYVIITKSDEIPGTVVVPKVPQVSSSEAY
jgi:DNA repair exonuclease SbcCD ATPase subunit